MRSKTYAQIPADGKWHTLLQRPVGSLEAPTNCEIDIDKDGIGHVRTTFVGKDPVTVGYTCRG